MSARQRRFFGLGLLAAATAIAVASIAWACTPIVDIEVNPTAVAAGGTPVSVSGSHFVDGSPVQIRMESQDYGQLLATTTARGAAQNATFDVQVTVPRVPDDTYTIVATGKDERGEDAVARQSLVVGQPGNVPTATARANRTPSLDGSEPARSGADGVAGGRSRALHGGAAPRPASIGGGGSAGGAGSAAAAAGMTRPGAPPARPGATRSSAVARHTGPATHRPAPGSATGDLWSGFSAGKGAAVRGEAASEPIASADAGRPQIAIGAALLGLGLVALLAAFGVAEARRRRAPAGRP
jgi:hypothetical protein